MKIVMYQGTPGNLSHEQAPYLIPRWDKGVAPEPAPQDLPKMPALRCLPTEIRTLWGKEIKVSRTCFAYEYKEELRKLKKLSAKRKSRLVWP